MALTLDILLVDDEPRMLLVLKDMLSDLPHRLHTAMSLKEAREKIDQYEPELVVCDLRLGEDSGLDLLRELNKQEKSVKCIMLTAHGDVDTAVHAIKYGAFDFLLKPVSEERLLHTLRLAAALIEKEQAAELLKAELDSKVFDGEMLGASSQIVNLKREMKSIAHTNRPVLIQGESGVGKELVARAIHSLSERANRPLVIVNCATLSKDLAESELFGHEKGSFTGADSRRRGKFELADKSSLFLDEIGEMPLALQPKLLRVLEDGTFERVGGESTLKVDVRIIAATNRDLKEEVDQGRFRLDLFHRINTFTLQVPPLSERGDDILILANYFAARYARESGKSPFRFSNEAAIALKNYRWPGNIRELRNVVERACATVVGDLIELPHIGVIDSELGQGSAPSNADLSAIVEAKEKEIILSALKESNWIQARAARALGLNRSHLHYKIRKLGIKLPE